MRDKIGKTSAELCYTDVCLICWVQPILFNDTLVEICLFCERTFIWTTKAVEEECGDGDCNGRRVAALATIVLGDADSVIRVKSEPIRREIN